MSLNYYREIGMMAEGIPKRRRWSSEGDETSQDFKTGEREEGERGK